MTKLSQGLFLLYTQFRKRYMAAGVSDYRDMPVLVFWRKLCYVKTEDHISAGNRYAQKVQ